MKLVDAAIYYAKKGWYVMPLHEPIFTDSGVGCTCEAYYRSDECKVKGHSKYSPTYTCRTPGKHPRHGKWEDVATIDEAQIRKWWKAWPTANIGLAVGKSGMIALDNDTYKDFFDGDDLLTQAEQETITNISGGGGEHLLFQMPEGECFGNHTGDLPDGIDIRGCGGMIVIPPSMHPSGNQYQWEDGYRPSQIDSAPLPEKIYTILKDAKLSSSIVAVEFSYLNTEKPELDQWDLSDHATTLIHNGHESADRSSTDMSVVNSLVKAGATDDDILAVFSHYPIGAQGKFNESGEQYLARTIENSRSYIGVTNEAIAILDNHEPSCMTLLEYEASDGGIADYWLDKYKNEWMFAAGYEVFYMWNETHWRADEDRVLQLSIQQTMIEMHKMATMGVASCHPDDKDEQGAFKKFITATKRSASRVASVANLIQAYIAVRAADLDTGNILNLQNGTLDLDTYELRPHTPSDNLTYCLPYEYDADADCPRYKQFLFEVLVKEYSQEPDTELCILYQELLGYSLTMDTKHELMIWQAGEGANGKSVATRIIKDLLGPIAMEVDFQVLGMPGNYDLSDIPNKRVLFSTEAAKGGRVAENYVKKIVSGENIRTRGIFQKPFEFQSMAKIWWSMNDRPIISDTTNAIWRRLILIPFYREFSDDEKDENLYEALHGELSGILNFALHGLIRLRTNGKFQHSHAVTNAVAEYRRESNPVTLWLDERTTPSLTDIEFPDDWTLAKELYADYSLWCQQNGRKPFNSTNFGKELKRFKIENKHTRTGRIYALCVAL